MVQCFLSLHGVLPMAKKPRHFYWKVNHFKMIQNYAYEKSLLFIVYCLLFIVYCLLFIEREEFIVNDYFVLRFR